MYLRLLILFPLLAISLAMSGQKGIANPTDETEMSWEESLNSPAVPAKANASLARHMESLAKWFKKYEFETHTVRHGEVLVVTIPASTLFEPNSTELKYDAGRVLTAFEQALKHPASYRLLIVAHTDDTGSAAYADHLTDERSGEVTEALEAIAVRAGVTNPNIHSYYFGREKPVTNNHSIADRARNRRIEVYIVPETLTVNNARAGKL